VLRVHCPREIARLPLPQGVERQGDILVVRRVFVPVLVSLVELWCTTYAEDLAPDAAPSWAVAAYVREKPGAVEHWKRPRELRDSGQGDCEDHVIYEVVRLRRLGTVANPAIRPTRERRYHAIVQAQNELLDPSRAARAARLALRSPV